MATIDLQGTEFSFTVLKKGFLSDSFWTRIEISIQNEFTSYKDTITSITREELEDWIFSMFRLLAGAYAKEKSISFERAGLAVDLCAHTQNGNEVSRQERRKNDCVMLIRLLLRSTDKKRLLGGVQSFIFHREDIQRFANALREEYQTAFGKLLRGKGEYRFVGVSPLGYTGCNYWYLDPTNSVEAGDRVWVRMGRHDTEQIVVVDSVRFYSEATAPYPPQSVKRILKKESFNDKEIF